MAPFNTPGVDPRRAPDPDPRSAKLPGEPGTAGRATTPVTRKPLRDSAAPRDAAARAALFESVMANAKDAVLITEAEPVDLGSAGPKILYVNEAFTAMTGYTSADAVGRTPRILQSPLTDQRELDRLRRALRRWEPVQVELCNVRKDGTEFWVQFIIAPVADADGWYTHWVSIQRDVTARRNREEQLWAMVRASQDVMLVVGGEGTVRGASHAAVRVLAPEQELVGTDVLDLFRYADKQALGAALGAARLADDAGAAREFELRTAAGARWFEVSARLASVAEDDESVVLTAVDVTERRQARTALLQARQRFEGAFVDAPFGMAVLGPDGSILEVNQQLCRLVGRTAAHLLTLRLEDFVHVQDRSASRAERKAVLSGAPAGGQETRLLNLDGRVAAVMLTSAVVRRNDEAAELVVHVEDITERKALQVRLTHRAQHDDLTQLPNRAVFLDRLEHALQDAARDQRPVSMLFIDLDGFKAVNDSLGHQVGDRVLRTIGRRLTALVRPGDTAARFAGDEFTLLCDDADAAQAAGIAERVSDAIHAPMDLPQHHEFRLRASIGVATASAGTMTADGLIADADAAMYVAKQRSEVRYESFGPQLRAARSARVNDAQELRHALDHDELELRYQPICSLADPPGTTQFEALVRWQHPDRGLLLPGLFIGLAEENGLIVDLDHWVLEHACRAAARFDGDQAKVWVNVSARTLGASGFEGALHDALSRHGLSPSALGLELTERTVAEGGQPVSEMLDRLREAGVCLAADDFGTGYSSLSALIERPVDVLKIDRSFVSALPSATSIALIRAIVAMADALGLQTVGEGVEREDQLHALRALGCTHAQGFLLARPLSDVALHAFYEKPDG